MVTGLGFASAEQSEGARAMPARAQVAQQRMEGQAGMPPMMTTGDAAVDAKLRTLTIEMEAKIKVIRDEYQVKIKALIGTRKLENASSTRPRMNSTSTRPMMRKDDRGTSTRQDGEDRRDDRPMMASTTEGARPPMPRLREGQVRGVMTEQERIEVGSRVMNFFRGFLGASN